MSKPKKTQMGVRGGVFSIILYNPRLALRDPGRVQISSRAVPFHGTARDPDRTVAVSKPWKRWTRSE